MDKLAASPPSKHHQFAKRHGLQKLAMLWAMHIRPDLPKP
jgi:hypothetical protein